MFSVRLTEFDFRQYFSSSLPAANLKRTENKTISVKPIHPVRPARSELLAPLEARYTLRSKGASPYAHREMLPMPVGRYSLRSEGAFPCTRLTEWLPSIFFTKFACGKLEANRKQNYICKTKFNCSPRTEN